MCTNESRSIVLRAKHERRESYLYYVYFKELNLWKIGVTTSIATRFNGEIWQHTKLHVIKYSTGIQAYFIEEQLKLVHQDILYKGKPLLKRKGNTELLTTEIQFIESVELIENTDEYKELVRKLVE